MNELNEAIEGLRKVSELLRKASMNPKLYNTDLSQYAEKLSNILYHDAQQISSSKEFWKFLENT